MFGVVIWHDEQKNKAVIWCEDHGDLAYCRNTKTNSPVGLDAGDWVRFDLTMGRRQRYAHNLSLVHEGAYADLPETLSSASMPGHLKQDALPSALETGGDRASAKIIPFPPHQTPYRLRIADRRALVGREHA